MLKVTCLTYCVVCCAYHLSPVTNSLAMDPPPSNSPTMHCRKNSKRKESSKCQKTENVSRYANISDTLYNPKSPVQQDTRFRDMDRLQRDRHRGHIENTDFWTESAGSGKTTENNSNTAVSMRPTFSTSA